MREAAEQIRSGWVVVFPTTGLYGLGADALDPEAVDRVFDIKQRPANNPLLVLIDHRDQVTRLARRVPRLAEILMERFWPGGVTIVFEARPGLPENLTAGTGKIGIRMPGHPVARELVNVAGMPITGTSANLSGRPGCFDITQLDPSIMQGAALVLDAGALKGGPGSTVIDVTREGGRILRHGAVSESEIRAALYGI